MKLLLRPPSQFFSAPINEQRIYYWRWVRESAINLHPHLRPEHIEAIYSEGEIYNLVSSDQIDFLSFLRRFHGFFPNFFYGSSFRNNWFTFHQTDFRQKLSYRKSSTSQKKILSEEAVSANTWREYKQIKKDRSKNSFLGRRKKRAKIASNRSFRRHQRQAISQGNYESFSKTRSREYFNSYDWD